MLLLLSAPTPRPQVPAHAHALRRRRRLAVARVASRNGKAEPGGKTRGGLSAARSLATRYPDATPLSLAGNSSPCCSLFVGWAGRVRLVPDSPAALAGQQWALDHQGKKTVGTGQPLVRGCGGPVWSVAIACDGETREAGGSVAGRVYGCGMACKLITRRLGGNGGGNLVVSSLLLATF